MNISVRLVYQGKDVKLSVTTSIAYSRTPSHGSDATVVEGRVHIMYCQRILLVTGRVLASAGCVYLWKGDPHHNHLLGHICGLNQAALQQQ